MLSAQTVRSEKPPLTLKKLAPQIQDVLTGPDFFDKTEGAQIIFV